MPFEAWKLSRFPSSLARAIGILNEQGQPSPLEVFRSIQLTRDIADLLPGPVWPTAIATAVRGPDVGLSSVVEVRAAGGDLHLVVASRSGAANPLAAQLIQATEITGASAVLPWPSSFGPPMRAEIRTGTRAFPGATANYILDDQSFRGPLEITIPDATILHIYGNVNLAVSVTLIADERNGRCLRVEE